MWQKTKHGLYKQFNFKDFQEALGFINRIGELAEELNHYPRIENEWSVVQVWLISHEGDKKILLVDEQMSDRISDIYNKIHKIDHFPEHPTVTFHEVRLFADGGSRGNPGPSSSGFVILDKDSDQVLVDKGIYLGITTNNQAEYTALKLGLEECLKHDCKIIHVFMDSLLVINQMKGIYKIRNRDLWPIHNSIKSLSDKFESITFQHVPREFNKLADSAVNRALDEQLGIAINKR